MLHEPLVNGLFKRNLCIFISYKYIVFRYYITLALTQKHVRWRGKVKSSIIKIFYSKSLHTIDRTLCFVRFKIQRFIYLS
jgi:hypothetical protein